MANSFEILRARIVIDAKQVKTAVAQVDQLTSKLKDVATKTVIAPGNTLGTAFTKATAGASKFNKLLQDVKLQVLKIGQSAATLGDRFRALTAQRQRLLDAAARASGRAEQLRALGKAATPKQRRELKRLPVQEAQLRREADIIQAIQTRLTNRLNKLRDEQSRRAQQAAKSDAAADQRAAQARIESFQRAFRIAQAFRIQLARPGRGVAEDAATLARINRLQQILVNLQKRTTQGSKEWLAVRRELATLDRAKTKFQPVTPDANAAMEEAQRRLRDLLTTARQFALVAGSAPGVPQFFRSFSRLTAFSLGAVRALSKLVALTPRVALGLAALVTTVLTAVVSVGRLIATIVRLSFELAKGLIVTGVRILTAGLRGLLAPTLAAVQALRQLFSIQGATGFAQQLLGVTAKFDTIRQQLSLRFGASASAEFNRLAAEADLFGSDLATVTEQFARFALAVEHTKLPVATVRKLFTGIQAALAVFGGGAGGDVEGILLALQQIESKGKLTAEELVRQLGNRIPGAFALAARSIGITSAELEDKLRDGAIKAEEFLPKFANQLVLEFFAKAVNLTDRLQARMQRLLNLRQRLQDFFGEFLSRTVFFGIERIIQGFVRMRALFGVVGQQLNFFAGKLQEALAKINFRSFAESAFLLISRLAGEIGAISRPLLGLLAAVNLSALAVGLGVVLVVLKELNQQLEAVLNRFQKLTKIDLGQLDQAVRLPAAILRAMPTIINRIQSIILSTVRVALAGLKVVLTFLAGILSVILAIATLLGAAVAPVLLAVKGFAAAMKEASTDFRKELEDFRDVVPAQFSAAFRDIGRSFQQLTLIDFKDRMIEQAKGAAKQIRAQISNVLSILFTGEPRAATDLKDAASDVDKALKGKGNLIFDVEEFVRQINSSSVSVATTERDISKQIAENTASAAISLLTLARATGNPLITPFAGRGPGGLAN